MATYTINTAKHATLTANTVDTVTFINYVDEVEVLNRGTTDLYFRSDGTAPTAGGDDCYIVTAGGSFKVNPPTEQVSVKVISTAAVAYSVSGS